MLQLMMTSPNTGVDLPIAPFIFGGLALVLIAVMVVMTLTGKKKSADNNDTAAEIKTDEDPQ
ncbi:MAG: hypothetical protein IJC43_03615 [Clostridia bacterium]|nr:hypothetical protein [Clostridia bacterium]